MSKKEGSGRRKAWFAAFTLAISIPLLTAFCVVSASPIADDSCPTPPSVNVRTGKNVHVVLPEDEDLWVGQSGPYGEVRGTVYEESGEPAKGIVIVIEAKSPKATYRPKTDKHGKYAFTGLAFGEYAICVASRGSAGLSRKLSFTRDKRLVESDFDLKFFDGTTTPAEGAK